MTKTHRPKQAGREHLVLNDKGGLAGLYALDVEGVADTESWEAIDLAIREYTKIHQMEMKIFLMEVAEVRAEQTNRYGASKGNVNRRLGECPIGLSFKLQQIMPDLFTNYKRTRHFFKQYPGFRTCEII